MLSGIVCRMSKKPITAAEMGRRGGRVRAARYSKRVLSEWGRRGGRPTALDDKDLARLEALLRKGKSQSECARAFGKSVRTIGRVAAQMKARTGRDRSKEVARRTGNRESRPKGSRRKSRVRR